MFGHTLGNPADRGKIRECCDVNNLWLIEDCCDALGSTFNGHHVGTFGDIGTLSFYPAHHITTGEGGAVFTNSGKLKPILESFRDWGRDCFCPPGKDNSCGKRFCWNFPDLPKGYDHKDIYSHVGYNLKMGDVQAACGLAQMERLPDFVRIRRENFGLLKSALDKFQDYISFTNANLLAEPSWFGFPIMINDSVRISRDMVVDQFSRDGIGFRFLFAGNLTRQPMMKGVTFRKVGELLNTDKVMNDLVWVGLHPLVDQASISRIVKSFEVVATRRE